MYIKIKRGIDLILALGLLIIFGIPMCIIAICIKLEDGGQVIYKSKRMGKGLKEFNVYKFRSMTTKRKRRKKIMKRELIVHQDPKSPISEVFRTLRTNIQFMNTKGKLKTILVTSTLPGEGKSWVSSNLAVTFAQAGKKVVLIDADMRKGRQY